MPPTATLSVKELPIGVLESNLFQQKNKLADKND